MARRIDDGWRWVMIMMRMMMLMGLCMPQGGLSIHMSVIALGQSWLKSAATLRGRRDLLQECLTGASTCLGADVLSGMRRGVAVAHAQGIYMHATACATRMESISF